MIDSSSHDVARIGREVVHHLPDAVIVTTGGGEIVYVNPAFTRLTGRGEEREPRRNVWEWCDEAQADALRGLMTGCAGASEPAAGPLLLRLDDGDALLLEARVVGLTLEGGGGEEPGGFIIYLRPRSHDSLLRESEQRYALAARGANDGLMDWNIQTRQVYYSPRWKSLLGFTDDDISNSPDEWFRRVHPGDIEGLRKSLKNHLHSQSEHFEASFRILNKQNVYRWVDLRAITLYDGEGRPVRLCGAINDVTQRCLAEEQLSHDAFHDALTGLPNRPLFLDRLKQQMNHAKRHEEYNFAILFLDLDRFKIVNDTHGHLVGDQLLVRFAQRLEGCLRPNDTVARLGGDEFAILLVDVSGADEPRQIAERLLDVMKPPFEIESRNIHCSSSIGIAIGSHAYDHPNDVLRDADTAMYRAKSRGRARFEVFDKSMHTPSAVLPGLEAQLRRAVDQSEIVAHFQPLVELDYLRLTGVEALARWQHPEQGVWGADRFIRMAEEIGLIGRIDQLMLEMACAHFGGLLKHMPLLKGGFSLNVNMSWQHLHESECVRSVKEALENTGFDPELLCIEISEEMLKDAATDATLMHLYQLRDMGIRICVDNFGLGILTQNSIDRFPIDRLKIDRVLVQKITDGNGTMQKIADILCMADTLRMDVVAEGVSSVKQLVKLREMKCPFGQGYLFSKPLDAAQLEVFLATNPGWTNPEQP